MIIKIIPEGNETIKEVEHRNVKEFLIFGNKIDNDGTTIDFHDWSGQYRYLIGSMNYFLDEIKLEKEGKAEAGRGINVPELNIKSPSIVAEDHKGFIKRGTIDKPELKILGTDDQVFKPCLDIVDTVGIPLENVDTVVDVDIPIENVVDVENVDVPIVNVENVDVPIVNVENVEAPVDTVEAPVVSV